MIIAEIKNLKPTLKKNENCGKNIMKEANAPNIEPKSNRKNDGLILLNAPTDNSRK